MRNYFKSLNISSAAKREEVAHALRPGSDAAKSLSEKHLSDAQEILMHDKRRQVYTNNVNFFQTLHEAKHCLATPFEMDTHQWDFRLDEFDGSEQESHTNLRDAEPDGEINITS